MLGASRRATVHSVKRLFGGLLLLAALAGAGRATADPLHYGVADDWPKFHACGDVWWQSAAGIGYQEFRMTVQWDDTAPTVIPYQPNLQAAIDCAQLNGLRPILAVYPLHPAAIGSNVVAQAQFATFVSLVGQAFPGVQDIIVGNEPNVNRFWQPQYRNGQDAAATDYEHTLAQAYDALKTVRPDAIVWGPAISSRGNDHATATSNPSHSPVWFIKYLSDAYKASGRTKPIFDEFDMHPYPPTQDTDPFSKPFLWPQAGAANLDRIKQALWDGFNGTAQQPPAEQPSGDGGARPTSNASGLPIDLDEAGEQTVVSGHDAAYNGGPENVTPITEEEQSDSHVQLAEIAACDPDVKALLYFPLIDDTSLSGGFQSGNLFSDLTPKRSYVGVQAKIASAQGSCQGGVAGIRQGWTHSTSVLGAQAIFGGPGTSPGSRPAARTAGLAGLWTSLTVSEDATYTARIVKIPGGPVGPALTGTAKAYFRPGLHFTGLKLPAGTYQFQVALAAATNPSRTTSLTSPTFTVGRAAKTHPSGRPAPHTTPKKKCGHSRHRRHGRFCTKR